MNDNTDAQGRCFGLPSPYKAEQALRYNEGKIRYSLIDIDAQKGLAEVLTYGAQKYTPNNWRKGMPYEQVIDSLLRHLAAFRAGEDVDPESGCLHIDHVACNVMFLQSFVRSTRYADFDDRPGRGVDTSF